MKIAGNILWEDDSAYDLRQIVGVEVIKEHHSRQRGYYPECYYGWQLYIVTIGGAHLKVGCFAEMPSTHVTDGVFGSSAAVWIHNKEYKPEEEVKRPLLEAMEYISKAIDVIRK